MDDRSTPLEKLMQPWQYAIAGLYILATIAFVYLIEIPEWIGIALIVGFGVLVRIMAREVLIFEEWQKPPSTSKDDYDHDRPRDR